MDKNTGAALSPELEEVSLERDSFPLAKELPVCACLGVGNSLDRCLEQDGCFTGVEAKTHEDASQPLLPAECLTVLHGSSEEGELFPYQCVEPLPVGVGGRVGMPAESCLGMEESHNSTAEQDGLPSTRVATPGVVHITFVCFLVH